jgi:hypothetical protein
MAEWGPFSRLKVPFYLYVPPNALDTARRLCSEHQIAAAEIWTYHTAVDQVRFTMVHRIEASVPRTPRISERAIATPAAKPAARPAQKPAAKPAKAAKPATKVAAKTAQKAAPKARKAASRPAASAKAAKRR